MTPKRKLGIAAAVLVIAAVAVLLQARDNSKKPGIAANFLRYENDNDGQAAIVEITNLSRTDVIYMCFEAVELSGRTRTTPINAPFNGGKLGVEKVEQFALPAFSATTRYSTIQVLYSLERGRAERCAALLMDWLGIQTPEPRELSLTLTLPPIPPPKTPLP
jgi:hypothetical protein